MSNGFTICKEKQVEALREGGEGKDTKIIRI